MAPPTISLKQRISKAKNIHKNTVGYDLISDSFYINVMQKLPFYCKIYPEHGIWWGTFNDHINCKSGCPKCGNKIRRHIITVEELKTRFKLIHRNDYNYDLFFTRPHSFSEKTEKIIIKCNTCNKLFKQSIHGHMYSKQGCPNCQISKGESAIRHFLEKHQFKFIPQYKFDGCKGIRNKLPFDFYIPSLNTCIEYDGLHHFKERFLMKGRDKWFRRKDLYEATKICDKIKSDFCAKNNILLIRISYKDPIIKILKTALKL